MSSEKKRGRPPTWTPADVVHLRWYAERGFSMSEAGAVMGKSAAAVAQMASRLRISFHGPPGAPFLNHNNSRWQFRAELKRIVAGVD